jgi:c-di-GMP-binding flagellar brake protein YcgR
MEPERRRAPRISFVASAEVLAESLPRMSTRISDISLSGCYVDTINPLNSGTVVHVKIFTDLHVFEASASVAFSHRHLGMGLAFKDVQPRFQQVLQRWLPAAV